VQKLGYETKPIGSSDLDQILTDTNADYAEYRLFICKKEGKFVHSDIHDKEFEGKCPSDGTELIEIREMPPLKCPRCHHASIVSSVTRPMDESSDTPT
jgi:hypothetical protein